MDTHERAAVEKRLAEVEAEIDAIPKRSPLPTAIQKWRELLAEQIELQAKLRDGS